jgi:hypothetical protein
VARSGQNFGPLGNISVDPTAPRAADRPKPVLCGGTTRIDGGIAIALACIVKQRPVKSDRVAPDTEGADHG